MAQLQILEHVVYADGSTTPVNALITTTGCSVVFLETNVSLTWDQMADMEHLSNVFEDMSVRAFKVIVKLIGLIYSHRKIYETFFAADLPIGFAHSDL
jgi:hypothetical protein